MDANSDWGSIRICYHLSGERGKILFLKWNLSPFLCLIIPTNHSWITGYGGMSCVYWFRLIKIYLWNWEWCQLSLYLVAVENTDTWKKKKDCVRNEEVEEWEQSLLYSTYKFGTFVFEQMNTALIPCVLCWSREASGQSPTNYAFNSNNSKMVTLSP